LCGFVEVLRGLLLCPLGHLYFGFCNHQLSLQTLRSRVSRCGGLRPGVRHLLLGLDARTMLRLVGARRLELGLGVRCHRRRRRGARVLRVRVHLVVGGRSSAGRARRGVRSALLGARGLRSGS